VPDFIEEDSKAKGADLQMFVPVCAVKHEAAEIEVLGELARRETV
jgi:hypothetical protein